MTYKAIKDEIAALRFSTLTAKYAQIGNWVNWREGEVWQKADWPIKDSVQLNLTVTGGTATIALPTGMTWTSQALVIRDNYGTELNFLEPAEFYEAFGAQPSATVPSGQPTSWTLVTDPTASAALVFRVGPTPSASATFTVHGWNQPIKRTGAATWTIGTMSGDNDLPWWPDAYHYLLVDGAIATGKRLEGDPSWQADEQSFQSALGRLERELMPLQRSSLEQWGDYWSPCV